jgi:hypothetical protein
LIAPTYSRTASTFSRDIAKAVSRGVGEDADAELGATKTRAGGAERGQVAGVGPSFRTSGSVRSPGR